MIIKLNVIKWRTREPKQANPLFASYIIKIYKSYVMKAQSMIYARVSESWLRRKRPQKGSGMM